MISLMYLVLTAMLALNVDKSVVDAFALVDQGFMKTIENFNNKNRSVYNNFDKAAQENPQKVGELNRTVQKSRNKRIAFTITSLILNDDCKKSRRAGRKG